MEEGGHAQGTNSRFDGNERRAGNHERDGDGVDLAAVGPTAVLATLGRDGLEGRDAGVGASGEQHRVAVDIFRRGWGKFRRQPCSDEHVHRELNAKIGRVMSEAGFAT